MPTFSSVGSIKIPRKGFDESEGKKLLTKCSMPILLFSSSQTKVNASDIGQD